ncbi:Eco57I restriction-modification methylase domain-containing protein, partial [Verrucomicrobiota bacterium]
DDYRFTFAARESEFDEDGNYVESETATRRYTYVLGPHESCRTAADRFYELSQKRDEASLDDVKGAFSVDKLNKEFFSAYKEHYQRFTEYLINSDYQQDVFGVPNIEEDKERAAAEKPLRDFAKRLLGRIVFLHFLQKKGWLGCPADRTDWIGGNPNFLRDLFENCQDKDHFHSACLIPLFHGAFNTPGRPNDVFELTGLPAEALAKVGTRIPYLNGGLFEQDDPDVTGVDFPVEYFDQLLDFFGQYNFTIDENDPEDHEVGIDPEMLGHIFENLLEDNKDKGAYYTPKAIVQYMCQESLIQYLKTHLGDHPELEQLVRLKTRGDEKNKKNFLVQNARAIEALLDKVKICDPAIGSGAFPIGLLKEIYWIKLTLDLTLDRGEVKRQIIQNSIYGVDVDAGAVEIARLRFWLALVVDEEEPSPLPNLDYKIMQGNSLLESFEGISLDNLTQGQQMSVRVIGSNQDELNLGAVGNEFNVEVDEERRQNIIALMDRYFSEMSPSEKTRIRGEIDRFVLDHIDYNIALHKERMDTQLHQLRATIKDNKKRAKGYKPTRREEKRLAELEKEIASDQVRKERLHELEHKPERPFFLWHLFFQNVFADGGFDIVIANPPYVRQEVIKDQKKALQAAYECYVGTADLFVYFYERSVKLLCDGGILTYITSNKYYRSAYGKKLREYLAKKLAVQQMIDFGDAPVFDAIAYASIFIASRSDVVSEDHNVQAYTWSKNDKLDDIGKVVRTKSFAVAQGELQPEAWRLESPEVMRLLEKLRAAGTPLGRYVNNRFYYGLKTGLNEAFIVDSATRDRLVEEDASSKDVLVPFLRGKDVKRWRVDFAGFYLIKIESSENKKHSWSDKKDAEAVFKKTYPAIYSWMKPFRDRLIGRSDQGKFFWELRSCAYYEEFETPKIILGRF